MARLNRKTAARALAWAALAAGAIQLIVFTTAAPRGAAIYNLGIDTTLYRSLAGEVLRSGWQAIPPSQPPGFLRYLAVFFALTREPLYWVKLVNAVLICGAALLTLSLGRTLHSFGLGMIAALLVIYSPSLAAYGATLQYETLALFLTTLAVLLFVRAALSEGAASGWICCLAAALAAAAAALVREPSALIMPAGIAALLRARGPRAGRRAAAATVVFLIPIAAWIVMQHELSGAWVLISNKGALNFQIGNNPNANGSFNLVRSALGAPAGAAFVQEFPLQAALLALRKIGYLWGVLEDGWNVPRAAAVFLWRLGLGVLPFDWCGALARAGLSLTAAAGLLIAWRDRRWTAVALLLLLTTLFYALFIGSFRFLVPLLPLVYLCAALFFMTAAAAFRGQGASLLSSGRRRTIWSAVLAAYVVCVSALPLRAVLTVPGSALDGDRVEDVRDPESAGAEVLYADGAAGPRLIALLPWSSYPAGRLAVTLRSRQAAEAAEAWGRLVVRRRNNRPLCELALRPMQHEYHEHDLTCTIPRGEPLSIEVRSLGHVSAWIEGLRVSIAAAALLVFEREP